MRIKLGNLLQLIKTNSFINCDHDWYYYDYKVMDKKGVFNADHGVGMRCGHCRVDGRSILYSSKDTPRIVEIYFKFDEFCENKTR